MYCFVIEVFMKKILNCSSCGVTFERKRFFPSKSGHYFCSPECQQKEQRVGGLLQVKHYGVSERYSSREDQCLYCGSDLVHGKNPKKYCNRECYNKFLAKKKQDRHNKQIQSWLNGTWDGAYSSGVLSKEVRQYLRNEHTECQICGQPNVWNGKLLTLQIDHVDGDYLNNDPDNLKVLCPNCHTQTPTYGAKNKGNGRDKDNYRSY